MRSVGGRPYRCRKCGARHPYGTSTAELCAGRLWDDLRRRTRLREMASDLIAAQAYVRQQVAYAYLSRRNLLHPANYGEKGLPVVVPSREDWGAVLAAIREDLTILRNEGLQANVVHERGKRYYQDAYGRLWLSDEVAARDARCRYPEYVEAWDRIKAIERACADVNLPIEIGPA